MDEKSIKLTWTPAGVAGIWLAAHVPTASREQQVQLGHLVEEMWRTGLKASLEHAIVAIGGCPTVGAGKARLEAMLDEIKQEQRVQDHKIDYDLSSCCDTPESSSE